MASIFHFSPGDRARSGGAVAAAGRNSGRPTGPSTAGGRPSTASTPASWAARSKRTWNVRSGDPARRSCDLDLDLLRRGRQHGVAGLQGHLVDRALGGLVAQHGGRHRLHLDLVAVAGAGLGAEADVDRLLRRRRSGRRPPARGGADTRSQSAHVAPQRTAAPGVAIGSPGELASSLSVTELLAPFRADPAGTGVFSDFDGTLAPIVDDPADGPAAARRGRRPGRAGPAATGGSGVISGRPAHLPADPPRRAGPVPLRPLRPGVRGGRRRRPRPSPRPSPGERSSRRWPPPAEAGLPAGRRRRAQGPVGHRPLPPRPLPGAGGSKAWTEAAGRGHRAGRPPGPHVLRAAAAGRARQGHGAGRGGRGPARRCASWATTGATSTAFDTLDRMAAEGATVRQGGGRAARRRRRRSSSGPTWWSTAPRAPSASFARFAGRAVDVRQAR